MTRKTAYRHPVKSHTRNGVKVRRYERGKGTAPAQTRVKPAPRRLSGYSVTVYYGDTQEPYTVPGRTLTDAARNVLGVVSDVPRRMVLRRAGG